MSGPHDEALDWAVALIRGLDNMDRAAILAAWNGEDGKRHREQMKQTAEDGLRQVVAYVKERLAELPAPPTT